jgi:hypothetical protein
LYLRVTHSLYIRTLLRQEGKRARQKTLFSQQLKKEKNVSGFVGKCDANFVFERMFSRVDKGESIEEHRILKPYLIIALI